MTSLFKEQFQHKDDPDLNPNSFIEDKIKEDSGMQSKNEITIVKNKIPLGLVGYSSIIGNRGAIEWNDTNPIKEEEEEEDQNGNNLIAIGMHNNIGIIDGKTKNLIDFLDNGHEFVVNRVLWNPFSRELINNDKLSIPDIISTDVQNNILIWTFNPNPSSKAHNNEYFSNIDTKSHFHKLESLFPQMNNPKNNNNNDSLAIRKVQLINEGTKLLVLYNKNILVVFDLCNNYTKNILHLDFINTSIENELLLDFDINPVNQFEISFLSYNSTQDQLNISSNSYCNWNNIHVNTSIKLSFKSVYEFNSSSSNNNNKNRGKSPSNTSSYAGSTTSSASSSTTMLRKFVSDIIVDQLSSSGSTNYSGGGGMMSQSNFDSKSMLNEFYPDFSTALHGIGNNMSTMLKYHPNMKDTIIILVKSEIIICYNTYFHCIMNLFNFSNDNQNIQNCKIFKVILTKSRPAIYIVYENGIISLKKYSFSSNANNSNLILENILISDNPRLYTNFTNTKSNCNNVLNNCEIEPSNETQIVFYLNDGRLLTFELNFENKNFNNRNSTETQPEDMTEENWKNMTGKKRLSMQTNPTTLHLTTPIVQNTNLLDHILLNTNTRKDNDNSAVADRESKIGKNGLLKLDKILGSILNSEADLALNDIKLKFKLKMIKVITVNHFTCIKCINDDKMENQIAAGTNNGFIYLMKIQDEKLRIIRKFNVHNNGYIVGGIKCIKLNQEQEKENIICNSSSSNKFNYILSWANNNISQNSLQQSMLKCELILTNIEDGSSRVLKQDGKSHIKSINISPLKQYFIILYKNCPSELYDLNRMILIKTLPYNKLPPISYIKWKDPIIYDTESNSKMEVFYMTGTTSNSVLYTFRLEGNRFTNASGVKLDVNIPSSNQSGGQSLGQMATPVVGLFTRNNLVYRAHSNGALIIYNTEKVTAACISLNCEGQNNIPLQRVLYRRDSSYFITIFNQTMDVWDINTLKRITTLLNEADLYQNKTQIYDIDVLTYKNCNLPVYISKYNGNIKFLTKLPDEEEEEESSIRNIFIEFGRQIKSPRYSLSSKEKIIAIYDILINKNTNINEKKEQLFKSLKQMGIFHDLKFLKIFINAINSINNNTESQSQSQQSSGNKDEMEMERQIFIKNSISVWITFNNTYNLHNNFADLNNKRNLVARSLIFAGEMDKAAEIYLDTDPSFLDDNKTFQLNGLKASLTVSSNNNKNNLPESTKAVLKILATNLLASGDQNIEEGLELLCILNRRKEACRYIIDNALTMINQMSSAKDSNSSSSTSTKSSSSRDFGKEIQKLWNLAILIDNSIGNSNSENSSSRNEIQMKYGNYLNTNEKSLIDSLCIYANLGKLNKCIEVLYYNTLNNKSKKSKRYLTYICLFFIENLILNSGSTFEKLNENISLSIKLDFARFLYYDMKCCKEAIEFCESLKEAGNDKICDLLNEFKILNST